MIEVRERENRFRSLVVVVVFGGAKSLLDDFVFVFVALFCFVYMLWSVYDDFVSVFVKLVSVELCVYLNLSLSLSLRVFQTQLN